MSEPLFCVTCLFSYHWPDRKRDMESSMCSKILVHSQKMRPVLLWCVCVYI